MSAARRKAAPTRDADATRASILDAAEIEFAKAGLLGARTEAISANTGVTKAMLYYYFDDKEGLYRAVLERAFARRMNALNKVDIHSGTPAEALVNLLTAYLEEAGTNQNLPAIFFYEAIQNQGKYFGQIAIASLYVPLMGVLERGMESGQFRKLNKKHVAVNIIGSCIYYFCITDNIKHLWDDGTDLLSVDMRDEHKREAIQQAIQGVLNHQQEQK